MTQQDKSDRSVSVEARVPQSNHLLVEGAAHLPPRCRLRPRLAEVLPCTMTRTVAHPAPLK